MTPNNDVHLFLASDEKYAPYACVMVASVLANTAATVHVHWLDGGVSDESKERVAASLAVFQNHTLEYLDASLLGLERFPNLGHYSRNTFSRYFIPALKPELSRALYFDADIVVCGDIAPLYHSELNGHAIGAVLEDYFRNYKRLKEVVYPDYQGGDQYFNAGVLLVDLEQWRRERLTDVMVERTIAWYDKLACADQDVFNAVFDGKFQVLDYRYNYQPELFGALKAKHPEIADAVRKNAVVLHYTCVKPWCYASIASKAFWRVAERTVFYHQLKQQARFDRFILGLKLVGYAIAVRLTWGKILARCKQKLDKTYSQW